MVLKKIIKKHYRVFSFYALVVSTLAIAFSVTGKNIHAYNEPIAAAAYATSDRHVVDVKTAEEKLKIHKEEITALASQIEAQLAQAEVFKIEEARNTKIEELSARGDIPTGLPLNGIITSEYGERSDPATGEEVVHNGIDIAADIDTPVPATAGGKVICAKYSDSYGYIVEIDHGNGFTTLYAHNNSLLVENGQYVTKGQAIALSGNTGYSTGPHLHYEVSYEGTTVSPENPLLALN